MFKFFDRYKRSLAMALAFTLLPNAQIASAASTVLNGEKYDVSVVWEPDQTEVQTGEQVTVTLKADFDKDGDLLDSAEVKIHLDEHEVLALQGIERFLEENNYQAIVTHFGDLGALQQLPGLAMQRLMEKGYGFGAEGDWKTAPDTVF